MSTDYIAEALANPTFEVICPRPLTYVLLNAKRPVAVGTRAEMQALGVTDDSLAQATYDRRRIDEYTLFEVRRADGYLGLVRDLVAWAVTRDDGMVEQHFDDLADERTPHYCGGSECCEDVCTYYARIY